MKSKEEIEYLAANLANPNVCKTTNWIEGYTQCQEDSFIPGLSKETLDELFEAHDSEDFIDEDSDKKYTEEDMLKCWNTAFIDAMNIDSETYKPIFYSDFINSLNKQD